jgi:glycosyltransferase involved in cell wall biosynthesis
MNIALFLEQPFDPDAGGVQRTTSKLAKIFRGNGHSIIIISVCNIPSTTLDWNGIPIFNVNLSKQANQLTEIFKNNDISVIINQAGYSFKLTKILIKFNYSEAKIINTLRVNPLNFYENHPTFISEFLNRNKIGFLNNFILRRTVLVYHIFKQRYKLNYIIKNINSFVMLSESFKPELYFLVPDLKKYDFKIHSINNPFERPIIDLKSIEKENVILFVGRLDVVQKRVDLLLEIWKELHGILLEWQFWIVGEGESQTYMKEFCSEYQLDRVTFFGKDNPNQYYKKAKIFHMTSAFEGFGNVLIEAQSYGCVPMLFDSYAAASDIVGHNRNGILIQPFDVEDYVVQTKSLMSRPDIISELATNSYENALRFSYEETYLKWEKVFNSFN